MESQLSRSFGGAPASPLFAGSSFASATADDFPATPLFFGRDGEPLHLGSSATRGLAVVCRSDHPPRLHVSDTCLACASDQLCDVDALDVHCQRVMEAVGSAFSSVFPTLSTKQKLRLWSAVLPGVLTVLRRGDGLLVHVYDLVTENFSAEEVVSLIAVPLLVYVATDSSAAELVLQLLTHAARHGSTATVVAGAESRVADFVASCILHGCSASREAGLYLAYVVLRRESAAAAAGDNRSHSHSQQPGAMHAILCSQFEQGVSQLPALLSPDAPQQTQLNLLGVLGLLLLCPHSNHDGLRRVVATVGQPPLLRKVMLCIVQVCARPSTKVDSRQLSAAALVLTAPQQLSRNQRASVPLQY
jgi:hypothetical protein